MGETRTAGAIGSNAEHPGELDFRTDVETAGKFFHLVCIMANAMITQPLQIEALYGTKIPEGARQSIEKRDGK